MLNGFKSPGKIALIGSNSEIGLSILKQLPKDPAAQTILVGRTGEYAVDVIVKEQRHAIVEKLFADGDLDVVIVAVGVLGNNPKLDEGENLLAFGCKVVTFYLTKHFCVISFLRVGAIH